MLLAQGAAKAGAITSADRAAGKFSNIAWAARAAGILLPQAYSISPLAQQLARLPPLQWSIYDALFLVGPVAAASAERSTKERATVAARDEALRTGTRESPNFSPSFYLGGVAGGVRAQAIKLYVSLSSQSYIAAIDAYGRAGWLAEARATFNVLKRRNKLAAKDPGGSAATPAAASSSSFSSPSGSGGGDAGAAAPGSSTQLLYSPDVTASSSAGGGGSTVEFECGPAIKGQDVARLLLKVQGSCIAHALCACTSAFAQEVFRDVRDGSCGGVAGACADVR